MDQIAKYSSAHRLLQNLKYEVSRSEKDAQGEVRGLFKKLSSWMEEAQRQFSSTINSHAQSMNKGLNDLSGEICDLETKLSVITKERDDLLNTVNNLSGGIRQWSDKLPTKQSLPEQEENHNQNIQEVDPPDKRNLNTRLQGARRPSITSEGADQEEHVEFVECIDQLVEQHIQTQQNNLIDCYSDAVEYENINNIEHVEQDAEAMEVGGANQTEKEAAERKKGEALCSSPYKSSQGQNPICQVCNLSFSTTEHLRIHSKNVHSLSLTIGKESDNTFLDTGLLKRTNSTAQKNRRTSHTKEVYDKRKNHGCDECGYTTNYKSDLKRHWDAVHNKGHKKHKCEICAYSSAEKTSLKYHMASIHTLGGKIKCDKCPFSSANKYTLKKHKDMVHEEIVHEKLRRNHV